MAIIFLLIQSCAGKDNDKDLRQPTGSVSNTFSTVSQPSNSATQSKTTPKHLKAIVLRTYTHDTKAYTQGLFIDQGYLYESTGLYGSSALKKIELKTGTVIKKASLPLQYFGEGIAKLGGKIYYITWLSQTCFVYDAETFLQETTLSYPGEGWGLTSDDKYLYMSDGTNNIRVIDPQGFNILRTISVFDRGYPVGNINELELVGGSIYANIWQQDRIAVIDLKTGSVSAWIDISVLRTYIGTDQEVDVLNGIAYDSGSKKFYLTGKNWPLVFEVNFVEKGE